MRIHGNKGQVKLDPTGAGGVTAVAVGSLNAWSLDMARDTVDVTAFQDTNKQYVPGLMDIKGTIGGWWDSAESGPIFDAAEGDVPVWLELIPSTLAPTYFWSGLAYLDASIDVSATGAVGIESNFVAGGPWSRDPGVLVAGEERAAGSSRARKAIAS